MVDIFKGISKIKNRVYIFTTRQNWNIFYLSVHKNKRTYKSNEIFLIKRKS